MNRYSKCNSKNSCHKPNKCCNRPSNCCNTPCQCPLMINGFPSSFTIPSGSAAGYTFTVATFTIDSSCLPDKCNTLQFTSSLTATGFTGSINFQIYKMCYSPCCNNMNIPIGFGSYTQSAAFTGTSNLTFSICNDNCCCYPETSNCCTYIVTANVAAATTGTLTINNPAITSISNCYPNNCCPGNFYNYNCCNNCNPCNTPCSYPYNYNF